LNADAHPASQTSNIEQSRLLEGRFAKLSHYPTRSVTDILLSDRPYAGGIATPTFGVKKLTFEEGRIRAVKADTASQACARSAILRRM
jgi:hypothetical protein